MTAPPSRRLLAALLLGALLGGCTTEFPEEWKRRDGAPSLVEGGGPGREPRPFRDQRLPTADLPIPPTVQNGQSCAVDGVCLSGHCADGVCCDSACTEVCRACNLPASVGACVAVSAGQKPAGEKKTCATTPATSCGLDGSCDGLGACRYWPSSTICKAQQCAGANKTRLASFCTGSGACKELLTGPASEMLCDPYRCSSGACLQSCAKVEDCVGGGPCEQQKCGTTGLKPIGSPCLAATECTSNFCAEGVCCNAACTEGCKTCLLEGAKGFCVNVPAGQKPAGTGKTCPVDTTPCGKDGTCDGAGACRVTPKGTACGAVECVGSSLGSFTCNGNANAPACEKQTTSCGSYTCQPSVASCFGRCTEASQCTQGKSCTGYQCR